MSFLSVKSIGKKIGERPILEKISFSLSKLQKLSIAGETGAGKSTLLKIIAGLEQADSGTVTLKGARVEGSLERLVPGHPDIAYLSQHFELQKFLTVRQVLSYANVLDDKAAAELFGVCQIDHLLERKTDQLSGGEKQRIALAKLLIQSPQLLLLDEPFTHLDMPHKTVLKAVIDDISAQLKITCVLVSHDPEDTLSWADKIMVLKDGKIVQHGPADKIYRASKDEYVAGLFGKYMTLTPTQLATIFNVRKIPARRVILRPEALELVRDNSGAKGRIAAVRNFGFYREVDVAFEDVQLTVRESSKTKLAPGKAVRVKLKRGFL